MLQVLTIEDIGGRVGLGSSDLGDSGTRLMRVGLGFAALAALVALILGGLLWMFSGPDQQRRRRALGIITGAVIGLVVIFLAWAITAFVIGTTSNVTN